MWQWSREKYFNSLGLSHSSCERGWDLTCRCDESRRYNAWKSLSIERFTLGMVKGSGQRQRRQLWSRVEGSLFFLLGSRNDLCSLKRGFPISGSPTSWEWPQTPCFDGSQWFGVCKWSLYFFHLGIWVDSESSLHYHASCISHLWWAFPGSVKLQMKTLTILCEKEMAFLNLKNKCK